jgi:lysophospholipase L1-like esterase
MVTLDQTPFPRNRQHAPFTAPAGRPPTYVAIGDSSTEGIDDPDGRGGYRGWADRLAEHLARTQGGSVLYANLAIRGRLTHQIRAEQLEPALAMGPDVATVFAGTNDLVSKEFDPSAVKRDLDHMVGALTDAGATVLTFTLPDLTQVLPMARRIGPKLRVFNDVVRSVADFRGARIVDFATHPVAADLRLWSDDRFHANALGHQRIAAGLAHALGLPGFDASWSTPLPPTTGPTALRRRAGDLRWGVAYLLPWLWRHARGRSSGDGRLPKRPHPTPVTAAAAGVVR